MCQMLSQTNFKPCALWAFYCISVGRSYVLLFFSCSEDGCTYIWDRYYQSKLSVLPHQDEAMKTSEQGDNDQSHLVTNGIAFCPIDQETCITVCDDHKIKIWRSKNRIKNNL